jgi:hypothetical protein
MVFPRLPFSAARLARLVALAVLLCAALPAAPLHTFPRAAQADADDAPEREESAEGDAPDEGCPPRPARHAPPAVALRLAYPSAPPGAPRAAVLPTPSAARGRLHLRC